MQIIDCYSSKSWSYYLFLLFIEFYLFWFIYLFILNYFSARFGDTSNPLYRKKKSSFTEKKKKKKGRSLKGWLRFWEQNWFSPPFHVQTKAASFVWSLAIKVKAKLTDWESYSVLCWVHHLTETSNPAKTFIYFYLKDQQKSFMLQCKPFLSCKNCSRSSQLEVQIWKWKQKD